jgi:DNA-binding CsgD family transcriptional regulator
MSVRAVVVAHREALAAEGIAAALGRYPALVTVGIATNAAELERVAEGADAAAVDARIPAVHLVIDRLRRRGLRVITIADRSATEDDDVPVNVPADARVAHLASALAPGVRTSEGRASCLSARERDVLRLAAKGMPGKQIARVLRISPKTVEQHKTRLFRKLEVPNQAAAVALLVEGGRV